MRNATEAWRVKQTFDEMLSRRSFPSNPYSTRRNRFSSIVSGQNLLLLFVGICMGYILTLSRVHHMLDKLEPPEEIIKKEPSSPNESSYTDVIPPFNLQKAMIESLPTSVTPIPIKTQSLPDSKRKRILVTGGAGFVGSHLVDKLMGLGHEVIVLDNFFTGQKRNIEHWLFHPNFKLVEHDVIDPLMVEVDQIYHLACPASPPHYQYNPVKTIKTR